MRSHYTFTIFFIISVAIQFPRAAHSINDHKNRRILHQPLLIPASYSPPPPAAPDFPDQDQPFSHELPIGPPLYQVQQPPQLPATTTPVAHPVATRPSKPTKKIAVGILSAILTIGMLSGMVFYLCKNCEKHHSDESQKLVGENTQRINEESRMPPPQSSNFLRIETAEPSSTSLANASPYRKLKSDRYRPSPEIQPLPPLKKLPPPPTISSPPPMSSSDDESHEHCFITNKESPVQRQVVNSVPHSKRTSPKSRFSSPSPIKKSLPPSPSPPGLQSRISSSSSPVKKSLPSSPPPPATSFGPLQPSKTLPYTPKRSKFSPSPPSDTERRRSMRNDKQQIPKIPIPPPPPPPPPPLQLMPRRNGAVKTNKPLSISSISKQRTRPKSKSPSPEATPTPDKTTNAEEVNKVTNSLEKLDSDDKDGSRPKMKPLHWDKVRAPSDRATVWDQLESSSFRLNEDAMESLFGRNSVNLVRREPVRKLVLPVFEQENRVLDPKKSQNIAILLRALNVTREEVSEALLDGNSEGLGPELFETLVKMAPTKEEEIKLQNCNDESSKLGPAERFLKAILDIPFAFKRVEAMLYQANFDTEVKYLRKSFQTLEEASEELKNSRLFLKLLEAVLRTGNHMNDGTNRGDAKAFKLDTLLKLVDIKGKDGKTTLLHFVVQEIIRSEGASESQTHNINFKFNEDDFKKQGLQVVAGLSKELGNVKKAAGMDSDVLSSYVSKLETGLQKVRLVLQYENQSVQGKFFDSMKAFLKEAVDEISRVKAEERKALSMVKEVTLYFHGDAANQEAHPLRIFMIIRDFLGVLDNVCKDVRTMQDRTTLGAGRSFRISATTPLPVLNRYNMRNDRSSDDDSM